MKSAIRITLFSVGATLAYKYKTTSSESLDRSDHFTFASSNSSLASFASYLEPPPSPPVLVRNPSGPPPLPVNPVQQLQQLDREGICRYGFPSTANVRFHDGYAVSFDFRTKNAYWACERIVSRDITEVKGDRSHSQFKEDESVPPLFRPKLSDYLKSGFDRGHLVPAADLKTSQKAIDDSFYLTNVSPQVGHGFNRDYWARLEQFCRNLAKDNKDVYVCTGPLYLPKKEADGKYYVRYQMIGDPPNTAVPTHFFKVILVESHQNTFSLGAFIVPNAQISQDTPIEKFVAPVEIVERSSGLMFFNKIPRQITTPLCEKTRCYLPPPFSHAKKDKKALPPPQKTPLLSPPSK